VNKTINLVLMILMAGLSVTEGVNIVQNGANARNVLFCLLFAGFCDPQADDSQQAELMTDANLCGRAIFRGYKPL